MTLIFQQSFSRSLYGGRCHKYPLIEREKKSKFYVSYEENNSTFFPPYCEGPFYFMSAHLAFDLARHCWDLPYNKFEDVFVGACIKFVHPETKFLNISRKFMRFEFKQENKAKHQRPYKIDKIQPGFGKLSVALHSMNTNQMLRLHQKLTSNKISGTENTIKFYLQELSKKAFVFKNNT